MTSSRPGVAPWQEVSSAVTDRLGGLGLMAVLGVSVLGVADGGPEWIHPQHVAATILSLAGVLIVGQYVRMDWSTAESALVPYRVGLHLLLLTLMIVLLYQSWSAGYGLAFDRSVHRRSSFWS